MKRSFVLLVVLIGVVSIAFAQRSRNYNAATVATISAEVVEINYGQSGRGRGVHLMVKTAQEVVPVHLGPEAYLAKQQFQFKPGDQVEVKGSRVTFNGKPAIIAVEVKKGDKTLKLREADGTPVWRGSRGGRAQQ